MIPGVKGPSTSPRKVLTVTKSAYVVTNPEATGNVNIEIGSQGLPDLEMWPRYPRR